MIRSCSETNPMSLFRCFHGYPDFDNEQPKFHICSLEFIENNISTRHTIHYKVQGIKTGGLAPIFPLLSAIWQDGIEIAGLHERF
jgi:hypothetical protein